MRRRSRNARMADPAVNIAGCTVLCFLAASSGDESAEYNFSTSSSLTLGGSAPSVDAPAFISANSGLANSFFSPGGSGRDSGSESSLEKLMLLAQYNSSSSLLGAALGGGFTDFAFSSRSLSPPLLTGALTFFLGFVSSFSESLLISLDDLFTGGAGRSTLFFSTLCPCPAPVVSFLFFFSLFSRIFLSSSSLLVKTTFLPKSFLAGAADDDDDDGGALVDRDSNGLLILARIASSSESDESDPELTATGAGFLFFSLAVFFSVEDFLSLLLTSFFCDDALRLLSPKATLTTTGTNKSGRRRFKTFRSTLPFDIKHDLSKLTLSNLTTNARRPNKLGAPTLSPFFCFFSFSSCFFVLSSFRLSSEESSLRATSITALLDDSDIASFCSPSEVPIAAFDVGSSAAATLDTVGMLDSSVGCASSNGVRDGGSTLS